MDEKVKESIARTLGMPFEDIANTDFSDIDSSIEKNIGKKLGFPLEKNPFLSARGNRNVAARRYLFFKAQ